LEEKLTASHYGSAYSRAAHRAEASAVVGSIMVRTWEMRFAGKPPYSAFPNHSFDGREVNAINLVVGHVPTVKSHYLGLATNTT